MFVKQTVCQAHVLPVPALRAAALIASDQQHRVPTTIECEEDPYSPRGAQLLHGAVTRTLNRVRERPRQCWPIAAEVSEGPVNPLFVLRAEALVPPPVLRRVLDLP